MRARYYSGQAWQKMRARDYSGQAWQKMRARDYSGQSFRVLVYFARTMLSPSRWAYQFSKTQDLWYQQIKLEVTWRHQQYHQTARLGNEHVEVPKREATGNWRETQWRCIEVTINNNNDVPQSASCSDCWPFAWICYPDEVTSLHQLLFFFPTHLPGNRTWILQRDSRAATQAIESRIWSSQEHDDLTWHSAATGDWASEKFLQPPEAAESQIKGFLLVRVLMSDCGSEALIQEQRRLRIKIPGGISTPAPRRGS
jgi:hypothetical protein